MFGTVQSKAKSPPWSALRKSIITKSDLITKCVHFWLVLLFWKAYANSNRDIDVTSGYKSMAGRINSSLKRHKALIFSGHFFPSSVFSTDPNKLFNKIKYIRPRM